MDPDTVKSTHEVHHELGMLPNVMSMPVTPLKAKWQLPNDRALYALLTYSPEDYQFIIDNSTPLEIISNVKLEANFYRDWIESEVKLETKYHDKYDSYEIIGAHPIQANLFTKAKYSPFVNGSITPLGNGLIFVSLYAM